MNIEWRKVTGSQEAKPKVIDKESSSKYVYLRKNIESITRTDENGNSVTLWQYDEALVTHEEYAPYDTLATELIQERVSDLESAQEKKNEAMQAQIDAAQANNEYIAMMQDIDLEG